MDAENFQRWISLLQGLPTAGKLGISTALVAIAAAILILLWQSPRTSPQADARTPPTPAVSVTSINQSGGQTAGTINNTYNVTQEQPDDLKPNVSFERVAMFYIEQEPNVYQMGLVIRIFNKSSYPRLFTGITFDPLSFQIGGGGPAYIAQVYVTGDSASNADDFAIPSSEYKEFKLQLPIKWAEQITGGTPPEIVFLNPFSLVFKDGVENLSNVRADWYGNFNRPITQEEWRTLLTGGSRIALDGIGYKRTPGMVVPGGNLRDWIIYNRDPTANIEVYGFDRTNYQRNPATGVLTMLKGNGVPVLDGGWTRLANSYPELFADAKALSIYESVLPADARGNLTALDAGFRGADRLTFNIPKADIPWMADFTKTPPYIGAMKDVH